MVLLVALCAHRWKSSVRKTSAYTRFLYSGNRGIVSEAAEDEIRVVMVLYLLGHAARMPFESGGALLVCAPSLPWLPEDTTTVRQGARRQWCDSGSDGAQKQPSGEWRQALC